MFKLVLKHSQPIGDHPFTDTQFLHIAWKYKPSQPIGDHPLWPCPLRVVSNFVRHSYISIYIFSAGNISCNKDLISQYSEIYNAYEFNYPIAEGCKHYMLYSGGDVEHLWLGAQIKTLRIEWSPTQTWILQSNIYYLIPGGFYNRPLAVASPKLGSVDLTTHQWFLTFT